MAKVPFSVSCIPARRQKSSRCLTVCVCVVCPQAHVEEERRGSGMHEDSETLPISSADSQANPSYQAYPSPPVASVNQGLSADIVAYRGPSDPLIPYPSQSTLSSADSGSTRASAESDKAITIFDALKIPVRAFNLRSR